MIVYIVEDDFVVVDVFLMVLFYFDYVMVMYYDGEIFLSEVDFGMEDVVVLDFGLLGIIGMEVVECFGMGMGFLRVIVILGKLCIIL